MFFLFVTLVLNACLYDIYCTSKRSCSLLSYTHVLLFVNACDKKDFGNASIPNAVTQRGKRFQRLSLFNSCVFSMHVQSCSLRLKI